MPVIVRDDLPWRADAWIERLVVERIATRLEADRELAERAGRAMAGRPEGRGWTAARRPARAAVDADHRGRAAAGAARLAAALGAALARDPAARPTADALLRGLSATPA